MTLHLQQPLVYTKEREVNNSLIRAYDTLLDDLITKAVTTDALLLCETELTSDLCKVSVATSYYREPQDEELPIFTLEAGTYTFHQVAIPPGEGAMLYPLFNRFASRLNYPANQRRKVYVRIFKERPLLNALQFIAPI